MQYQQDHGPEALSALILDQGFDDMKMCLELVHDYYTDKHLICLSSSSDDPSVLLLAYFRLALATEPGDQRHAAMTASE